ncbi:MFS transporter [Frigidibacter sp. MR17.14]|uniref:MFS transporter n=1 Tax=Frigidibacter sp. MR17.14 TaxID=3126509 RepID=UPI00301300C6
MARSLCFLGMQTMLLVLALTLYDLTENAFYLGAAGLMIFVPALALIAVSGLAADRLSRRLIVITCFAIMALDMGAICLLALHGKLTVLTIFLALGVIGIARAFVNPTLKALLINIVPRGAVPRAIALNTLTSKAMTIIGPVMGGLIYAAAPIYAYAFCAAALTIGTLAALGIRRVAQERTSRPARLSDLSQGFHTILGDRVLFAAMTLDLTAVLLGGATALLPVYAATILFVGPAEVGMLRAAPAAGTLLSAALLVWRPLERRSGAIMLLSIAGYGAAITTFGLSHLFWLSLVALAVAGAFDMVSIYVRENLIQLRTPDAMRGRVSAINNVFNSGANELGDFRAGTWAVLIGAMPAVVFGGLCSIAVAAIWSGRYRELMRLDRY